MPHIPFMNQWCRSARCVLHAAPSILYQRELRPTDGLCFPPFFVFLLTLTQFAVNYCISYSRIKFNTLHFFVQTVLYFYIFVFCCWEFDILCWKHNRKTDEKSQIHDYYYNITSGGPWQSRYKSMVNLDSSVEAHIPRVRQEVRDPLWWSPSSVGFHDGFFSENYIVFQIRVK